jgi:Xaa-Pro aminopeptidase
MMWMKYYVEEIGYGNYFQYTLGHGIGLSLHEPPFLTENSEERIEENNVICVEPGIFIPGWGGVRIENMVLVKKTGAEILNKLNYNQLWIL